jgi:hypothetical protein
LKVDIRVLFYGGNSLTVALRHMNFGVVKDHESTSKLYLNVIFFDEASECGDGAKF